MENEILKSKEQSIVELIGDVNFLDKIVRSESKDDLIKFFGEKGVCLSQEEADSIYGEFIQSIDKARGLSDKEVECIAGGTNVSQPMATQSQRQSGNSDSKPLTPIVGAAVGGAFAVVGTALAAYSIHKGIKKGWFSSL